jgi:hypothetical protein
MKVRRTLPQNILLASFYGGTAEVIWIALYCLLTGQSAAEVAREVTLTLVPGGVGGAAGVAAGLAIHFALSVILAMVYVQLVWRPFAWRLNKATAMITGAAALSLVWALNFLVVLPAVNPGFAALFPYGVSLVSKILFGLAMAGALHAGQGRGIRSMLFCPARIAV